jgi:hypothetical protein
VVVSWTRRLQRRTRYQKLSMQLQDEPQFSSMVAFVEAQM